MGALLAAWIGFGLSEFAWTLVVVFSFGVAVGTAIGLWIAARVYADNEVSDALPEFTARLDDEVR